MKLQINALTRDMYYSPADTPSGLGLKKDSKRAVYFIIKLNTTYDVSFCLQLFTSSLTTSDKSVVLVTENGTVVSARALGGGRVVWRLVWVIVRCIQ